MTSAAHRLIYYPYSRVDHTRRPEVGLPAVLICNILDQCLMQFPYEAVRLVARQG